MALWGFSYPAQTSLMWRRVAGFLVPCGKMIFIRSLGSGYKETQLDMNLLQVNRNHCRAFRPRVKTLDQAWCTSQLHGGLDRKVTNLRQAYAMKLTMRNAFSEPNNQQPTRKNNLTKNESVNRYSGFFTRIRIRMFVSLCCGLCCFVTLRKSISTQCLLILKNLRLLQGKILSNSLERN